tara:strand:- start:608 stop:1654 length:1047 start_codon:yes stop_codon:yes gene_type:complete
MKFYKFIIIILIVFLKTGNLLSDDNIFSVNNIELIKKVKTTNQQLVNEAIEKGFNKLTKKILLEEDIRVLSKLNFNQIKDLVSYYQVVNKVNDTENADIIIYNITFDKDKLHNLFYKKGISYSQITNKELFLLPILKKDSQIYIYRQNFFYNEWNEFNNSVTIDFILPQENIEVIQNININKNNLLNIQLNNLFEEYSKENLALVLIEDTNSNEAKIYLKIKIFDKNIVKNIVINKLNLSQEKFNEKIIIEIKNEIINIVKSQSLIDIRIPSFLNVKLDINKDVTLFQLNQRIKKIDLIENIYVQELNNKSVILKIKYLGKLDRIIKQLEEQKIILKSKGDQWSIKII